MAVTAQFAAPVAEALAHATRRGATYHVGFPVRLSAPALMVLGALVEADLMRPVFPASGVFLLLLLPVLMASVALGAVSGVTALILGAIGAWLLVAVRGHPWLTEPTDALRLVPYLFIGGFIVLVAAVLREAVSRPRTVGPPPTGDRLTEPLTAREAEVLALAASGLTTRQIGEQLYVTTNTVKSHLAHAYSKLGAHNRAEAVAAGLHSGALDRCSVVSRAPEITAGLTRRAVPRRGFTQLTTR